MQNIRGIILDLDGVVVDTEALHLEATEIVFARYDLRLPDGGPAAYVGRTDRDIFTEVVQAHGDRSLSVDELLLVKHEVYGSITDRMRPVHGAMEFVRAVAASSLGLALATSSIKLNQTRAFERFNLAPFFDAVVTADDVSRTKPDPEPYLLAASRLSLEPAECLVVEDSFNGVRSASQAGCYVVGLTTSFEADRLTEAGADLAYDSFEPLYDHIKLRRVE